MKRASIVLLALIPLIGCSRYGSWAKRVGSFSTTTAPALDQAVGAYSTANDIHYLEEQSQLVAQYAEEGYHPGSMTAFISQDELKSRIASIEALRNYANLIGDLALGKHEQELAVKTKTLNQSLSTLKAPALSATAKLTMTPQQQMSYALSGLDAAIKPIIEHKIHKNLMPVIVDADPSVQQMCTLLDADLSDLQEQVQSDYTVVLMEQSQFIEKNKAQMSAVESRAEILKLGQIERDQIKANEGFMGAQTALKQIATAHHRLATEGMK